MELRVYYCGRYFVSFLCCWRLFAGRRRRCLSSPKPLVHGMALIYRDGISRDPYFGDIFQTLLMAANTLIRPLLIDRRDRKRRRAALSQKTIQTLAARPVADRHNESWENADLRLNDVTIIQPA